jgi:uncharacterized protein
MRSPFQFGKIVGGEHFIDRESERQQLITALDAGMNCVVISPRRWGKSSLVVNAGTQLARRNPDLRCCFLDFFNIRDEHSFYTAFAREILRVTCSGWEERIAQAKRLFARLRPNISVGIDPMRDFSITFDWDEVERSPEEILNLPEKIAREKKIRLIVCLDEFQNIAFFDHPDAFQRTLRAHWQKHSKASYCIYGSKQHLMTELFEGASRPLYKFGEVLFLDKIPAEYWIPYITAGFAKTGKSIPDKLAEEIASRMENHPYFVQQLAHTVWSHTKAVCTHRELTQAIDALLTQFAILFHRETDGLTNMQVGFLRAMCENVTQFHANEAVRRYQLGSSANVNRIKTALIRKEIIDMIGGRATFVDPLFKLWFAKVYMMA